MLRGRSSCVKFVCTRVVRSTVSLLMHTSPTARYESPCLHVGYPIPTHCNKQEHRQHQKQQRIVSKRHACRPHTSFGVRLQGCSSVAKRLHALAIPALWASNRLSRFPRAHRSPGSCRRSASKRSAPNKVAFGATAPRTSVKYFVCKPDIHICALNVCMQTHVWFAVQICTGPTSGPCPWRELGCVRVRFQSLPVHQPHRRVHPSNLLSNCPLHSRRINRCTSHIVAEDEGNVVILTSPITSARFRN